MNNELLSTSLSEPIPKRDLTYEIVKADLIVVGNILKVSNTNGNGLLKKSFDQADESELFKAELSIIRILDGNHSPNLLQVFFHKDKTANQHRFELTEGQTVLLFLCSVNGGYKPVSPAGSPIQTLREIAPPPIKASRIDLINHELEQIILTADPIIGIDLIVQATVARLLLRGNIQLDLLDSAILQHPLRRRAWIAIALSEGKVELLNEVPLLFANPVLPTGQVLENLIVQKVSELKAPAARSQLVNILQHSKIELARAASIALRQIHEADVIPDLVNALNHADKEIRYQAVMGLAELEPSVAEGGPSFELYNKNENFYIQLWKSWRKTLGAK